MNLKLHSSYSYRVCGFVHVGMPMSSLAPSGAALCTDAHQQAQQCQPGAPVQSRTVDTCIEIHCTHESYYQVVLPCRSNELTYTYDGMYMVNKVSKPHLPKLRPHRQLPVHPGLTILEHL